MLDKRTGPVVYRRDACGSVFVVLNRGPFGQQSYKKYHYFLKTMESLPRYNR